ncbi:MAG: hypothetical protein QOD91_414 [Frankiales bacterium]|nr:hypothetical protein [Frankiales bacterium]
MSTYQSEGNRGPVPPPPPGFPPPPPAPDLRVVHDRSPRAQGTPRTQSSHSPGPSGSLGTGLRLADKRGLTGLGAVSLVVLVAAIAGAFDGHRAGNGLGWVFGITFVLCCLAAALLAHTEDMGAVAILPPLAFVVGALACAAFRPSVAGVSFTAQLRTEVLIAMLIGAPSLFVAEAMTLLTTGLRGMRAHEVARPHRSPSP